jgi:DNA ligase-1
MSSEVLNILNRLEATTKRNEKIEILEGIEKPEEFKAVAGYTYQPTLDYYIKEFDMPENHNGELTSVTDGFDLLERLNSREITGNEAREAVYKTLGRMDADSAEVLRRIIKRDLRCGVAPKTINKVFGDLIYIHPYMRCSSFSEKNMKNLEFPVITQTKMDGLYCDVFFMGTDIELRSRSGKILKHYYNDTSIDNVVLQGELLALDDSGLLLERSESNGYLNRDDIDWSRIVFFAWDIIDEDSFRSKKCNTKYEDRLKQLDEVIEKAPDWIGKVDGRECETSQEIIDHFKEVRKIFNEEGLIIKDKKMIWKDGTSKQSIKLKICFDVDLRIVDWKEGKGKFEGLIGSIKCESSDGKLSVYTSGFTDADRKKLTKNIDRWIEDGKIITVKANDIIKNQQEPDKLSLFLPRFVKIRDDKTEADSLERIQEQLKAFTDTLEVIGQ